MFIKLLWNNNKRKWLLVVDQRWHEMRQLQSLFWIFSHSKMYLNINVWTAAGVSSHAVLDQQVFFSPALLTTQSTFTVAFTYSNTSWPALTGSFNHSHTFVHRWRSTRSSSGFSFFPNNMRSGSRQSVCLQIMALIRLAGQLILDFSRDIKTAYLHLNRAETGQCMCTCSTIPGVKTSKKAGYKWRTRK